VQRGHQFTARAVTVFRRLGQRPGECLVDGGRQATNEPGTRSAINGSDFSDRDSQAIASPQSSREFGQYSTAAGGEYQA
jgi:hypothetical protein